MKKFLLATAVLLTGVGAINAQQTEVPKDPATYTFNTKAGVGLFSEWLVSSVGDTKNFTHANYPFLPDGVITSTDLVRSMAFKDGKLYFGHRVADAGNNTLALKIHTVDASTGKYLNEYTLPDKTFKRPDNGNYVGFPLNTLVTDTKGNLVMANLVTDLNVSPLQVWAMENETSEPKLILHQDVVGYGPRARVDFFDVYGDVFGDGYIIGGISETDPLAADGHVFKWDIKGGKIVTTLEGEPDVIKLQTMSPVQDFKGTPIQGLGGAPFVNAIDNEYFMVDGQTGFPATYKLKTGELEENTSFNDPAVKDLLKPSTGANGALTFTLGSQSYFIAGAASHAGSGDFKPCSFVLYKTGAYGLFNADMEVLYKFPEAGFGTNTTTSYRLVPFFVPVNDTLGYIYLWSHQNGFAKYAISTDPNHTGVNDIFADQDNITVVYRNNGFEFNSEVASADVYSISGAVVATAKNVDRVEASLPQGVYIVKTTGLTGTVNAQKVVVK